MIAIDLETYDPKLSELGDGSIRNDGRILCVGTYDGKNAKCFTPDTPELIDILASEEDKIFHNGIYDLSWLICGYNLKVGGRWHDTMTRSTLIDSYMTLDLDSCCKKFNVQGKNFGDTVDSWWKDFCQREGMRNTGSSWRYSDILWDNEPAFREGMIKYNIQDCIATYNLFYAQELHMKPHQEVYDLECRLYPLLMIMKKRGVRVDTVERERFTLQIKKELDEIEQQLEYQYHINKTIIASSKQLGNTMSNLGLTSEIKTATGASSWCADALDLIDHPVIPLIQGVKNHQSLLTKYLEGTMTNAIVNGRLHCTFSPNKRDSGGTITGRWASSKPNLQQVPARDDKHGQKSYGTEMRNLFIPDDGCLFGAFDYSAIEAVLLAHYAQGQQAEWFRQQIIDGADYHQVVMDMTGITSRDIIKRMNYGFIYGMGLNKLISVNIRLFNKLSADAGMSRYAYGRQLYDIYHAKFPVIKDTMAWVEQQCRAQGYIDGIGSRRHYKPKPEIGHNGQYSVPYYKLTNFLLQGSAAEILKQGMVSAFEAGIFGSIESKIDDDTILHAHLAVHDELDMSIPCTTAGVEAGKELAVCMTSAYKEKLLVPLKVSCEVGESWGHSNKLTWERMQQGVYKYVEAGDTGTVT